MFEELFLTGEEEKLYQLQKLEKRFILSEEDMLWELEKKRIEALDDFNRANESFQNYKRHLLNSKGSPSENSINRNLQVTPSASPKEATLPSVNSDISFNFLGFGGYNE